MIKRSGRTARRPAAAERIELGPSASSPARARRFLSERAAAWSLPEPIGDQLALVGTELVTNAVLHAHTSLTLTVELLDDRVRISVRDGSSAPAALRHYRQDALTGRGLGVIAAVSQAWGVEPARDGKVIWAEFDLDGGWSRPPTTNDQRHAAPEPSPGGPGARTIRFLGVSVSDYLELQAHNDALFRELQLIRIGRRAGGADAATMPPRLARLIDELEGEFRGRRDSQRDMVAAAQARGEPTVDMESNVSAAVLPAARTYVGLLEEADEFCRTGALLTPPPSDRVRRLRRWFVEEMAAQFGGAAPSSQGDRDGAGDPGRPRAGPAARG
jgi:anti-sigma regulatory factor (Ser/Thr protein kinase)